MNGSSGPSSAVIRSAEAALRVRARAPTILPALLDILTGGAPPAIRQTAGVLLRRYARKHAPGLPPADVRALMRSLLGVLTAPPRGDGGSDGAPRRAAAAAVSSLLPDAPSDCVPEVLAVAGRLAAGAGASAAAATSRGAAQTLARGVAELEDPTHAEAVAAIVAVGLRDDAGAVRLAAVKGVGTLLASDWEGGAPGGAPPAGLASRVLQPLLGATLALVDGPVGGAPVRDAPAGADAGGADAAVAVFGLLQELLDVHAPAVRPHFAAAAAAAVRVLADVGSDATARSAAGELVATCAGGRPKTFRRLGCVDAAVDVAFELLVEAATAAGGEDGGGDGGGRQDGASASMGDGDDDGEEGDDQDDDGEWRPGVLAARLLDALASEELLVNGAFARSAAVAQRVLAETADAASAAAAGSPTATTASVAARRAVAYRGLSIVCSSAGPSLAAAAAATPIGVTGLMGALSAGPAREAHPRPRAAAVRALASAAAALADGGGLADADHDADAAAGAAALAVIRDAALRAAVAALRDGAARVRIAGCVAVECVLPLYEEDDEGGAGDEGHATATPSAAGGNGHRPLAAWVDEIASALSAVGDGGGEAAVAAAAALADAAGTSLAASAAFPGLVTGVAALMARRGPESLAMRSAAVAAAGSLVAACVGAGGGAGAGAGARTTVVAPLVEAAFAGAADEWEEPTFKEATYVFFVRLIDAYGVVAASSVAGRLLPLVAETLGRDDGVLAKEGGGGVPGGDGDVGGVDGGVGGGGDVSDGDSDDTDSDGGGLVFTVRTAALDEKAAALEVLGALADALAPAADLPAAAYADPSWAPPADYAPAGVRSAVAAAAAPLTDLHGYFHEEVRAGALRASARLAAAAFFPAGTTPAAAAEAVAAVLLVAAEAVDGDDEARVAAAGLAAVATVCESAHIAGPAAVAVARLLPRLTAAFGALLRGEAVCQQAGLDDSDEEGGGDAAGGDGAGGGATGGGVAVWHCNGVARQALVDELSVALPAVAKVAPPAWAVDALALADGLSAAFCAPSSTPGDHAQAVGAMAETLSRLGGGGGTAAAAAAAVPLVPTDGAPPPPSPAAIADAFDALCRGCLPLATAAASSSVSSSLRRNGVYLLGVVYARVRPHSPAGAAVWAAATDVLRVLQARLDPATEAAAAVRDNAAGALGRVVAAAAAAAAADPAAPPLLSPSTARSAALLLVAALPLSADPDELLPVAAGLGALAVATDSAADLVHVPAVAAPAAEALVRALLVVGGTPPWDGAVPAVGAAPSVPRGRALPPPGAGAAASDALREGDVPRMVSALRRIVGACGVDVVTRLGLRADEQRAVEAWLGGPQECR